MRDYEFTAPENMFIEVLSGKEDNPNNLMCAKLVTPALFYGPLFEVVKNRLDGDVTPHTGSTPSEFRKPKQWIK